MADVVAAVAAVLASVPGRVVYSHGVPDRPVSEYFAVRSSAGEASSGNFADAIDTRQAVVYVTSVSRRPDPADAGWAASWGADRAVTLLAGRRLDVGRASWMLQHVASQPTTRDDELPEVVMYAVDQFLCQYQP